MNEEPTDDQIAPIPDPFLQEITWAIPILIISDAPLLAFLSRMNFVWIIWNFVWKYTYIKSIGNDAGTTDIHICRSIWYWYDITPYRRYRYDIDMIFLAGNHLYDPFAHRIGWTSKDIQTFYRFPVWDMQLKNLVSLSAPKILIGWQFVMAVEWEWFDMEGRNIYNHPIDKNLEKNRIISL